MSTPPDELSISLSMGMEVLNFQKNMAFKAAQNGNVEIIKDLIARGVDLASFEYASNSSLLHTAAENGHASVIAELSQIHGIDFDKQDSNGNSPAIIAAFKGHHEVIAELGKKNANFYQANLSGNTPAFYAASMGHVFVIAHLSDHIDFSIPCCIDGVSTPASIAVAYNKESVSNVITYLDTVAPDKDLGKTHTILINVAKGLGYSDAEGGICQGITMRWIEAHLLGEENIFKARIQRILHYGNRLPLLIEQSKAKKGRDLTDEDIKILEISAFFDSSMLFLNVDKYQSVFNMKLNQKNIEEISAFASSDKILAQGGLSVFHSELIAYEQEELAHYFDELTAIFEASDLSPGESVSVQLGSSNHAIGLQYTKSKGFSFMDINQYPPISIENSTKLAEYILKGFKNDKNTGKIFNLSMITTKANLPRITNLKQELTVFKNKHVVRKEISQNQEFMMIAIMNGDASVIQQLGKMGVNYKDLKDSTNTSLIMRAVIQGEVAVVEQLVHYGADINEIGLAGDGPLSNAIKSLNIKLIEKLLDLGANPNLPSPVPGKSILIAAIDKGNIDIITKLKNHGANFHSIIPSEKISAIGYAIKTANLNVIETLAELNCDFTQPCVAGFTPSFYAAFFLGKMNVLSKLIELGVDVNKPAAEGGRTLAYVAILKGNVSIISLLTKHNFNFSAPHGFDSLIQVAKDLNGPPELVVELEKARIHFSKPITPQVSQPVVAVDSKREPQVIIEPQSKAEAKVAVSEAKPQVSISAAVKATTPPVPTSPPPHSSPPHSSPSRSPDTKEVKKTPVPSVSPTSPVTETTTPSPSTSLPPSVSQTVSTPSLPSPVETSVHSTNIRSIIGEYDNKYRREGVYTPGYTAPIQENGSTKFTLPSAKDAAGFFREQAVKGALFVLYDPQNKTKPIAYSDSGKLYHAGTREEVAPGQPLRLSPPDTKAPAEPGPSREPRAGMTPTGM